jgi:hypothetical protein
MIGLASKVRVGLAAMVAAATLVGFAATSPGTAEAAQCYERYVAAPVHEAGIYCPGDPATWKSYTFASHGFGYYVEFEDMGSYDRLRVGYQHRRGDTAIAFFNCRGDECQRTYWNGVPFPV